MRRLAWVLFAGLLSACASTTGPGDAAMDTVSEGEAATDTGPDVSATCHADFHHTGTPACMPGYPAGSACPTRCTFCQPNRGSGGECVCDGAQWVCPGDIGCSGLNTFYTAAVPTDCH